MKTAFQALSLISIVIGTVLACMGCFQQDLFYRGACLNSATVLYVFSVISAMIQWSMEGK